MLCFAKPCSAISRTAHVDASRHISAPLRGSFGLLFFSSLLAIDVIDLRAMSSSSTNTGGQMGEAEIKLKKLEGKRERIQARIQRLRGHANAAERRRDTRRKILAGAFLIRLMGGDLKRVGSRLREAGFLRDQDLELFDLTTTREA